MIRIQDLVSATCTKVEEVNTATQAQSIFQINDPREAKLAFDLLTAYGFEAKLYNENSSSRLYVTPPKASKMENQALLAEALAYAHSLKALKQQADTIASNQNIAAPDYSISFATTPSLDKQIVVHLVSPNRRIAQAPATPKIAMSAAAPDTAAPQVIMGSRYLQKKVDDTIFSGPEITRQAGYRRSKEVSKGPDSLWKQFKTYLKGNAMAAGLTLGGCFAVLIVIISLFVVSKSFLCPDLAVVKKKVWYCSYRNDE